VKWFIPLFLIVLSLLVFFAARGAERLDVLGVESEHVYLEVAGPSPMRFEALFSEKESPYVHEALIQHASIVSEEGEFLLCLDAVDYLGRREVRGDTWHAHAFTVRPRARGEDPVRFLDASLSLKVPDRPALHVPIGNFAYHSAEADATPLSLKSVRNIHGERSHGVTSLGVAFTLYNQGQETVRVEDADLTAVAVRADFASALEIEAMPGHFETVEEILGGAYESDSANAEAFTVLPYDTLHLFVPFSYEEEKLLHRYPLRIEHDASGARKALLMEDFLFINTCLFDEANEGVFAVGRFHRD